MFSYILKKMRLLYTLVATLVFILKSVKLSSQGNKPSFERPPPHQVASSSQPILQLEHLHPAKLGRRAAYDESESSAFLNMVPFFIHVEMGDGSVHIAEVTPLHEGDTAVWMKPTMDLKNQHYHSTYIETGQEENNHQSLGFYWAEILHKRQQKAPTGTKGPVNARIHLQPYSYFAAENFKLYDPSKYHSRVSSDRPPINYVFVVEPLGPIYFAPLKIVDLNIDAPLRSEMPSIKRRRFNTK